MNVKFKRNIEIHHLENLSLFTEFRFIHMANCVVCSNMLLIEEKNIKRSLGLHYINCIAIKYYRVGLFSFFIFGL